MDWKRYGLWLEKAMHASGFGKAFFLRPNAPTLFVFLSLPLLQEYAVKTNRTEDVVYYVEADFEPLEFTSYFIAWDFSKSKVCLTYLLFHT